jgi:hypothetical protein
MNEIQEIRDRLARLEDKAEAIFVSAEKTRKYLKAAFYITVIAVVLPLLGALLLVPFLMRTLGAYGDLLGGL